MRKRPLLFASVGFTFGTLYGPADLPWVDLILGLLCFGIARRRKFRVPAMKMVFVGTGAFFLGLAVSAFQLPGPENIHAPATTTIVGDVVEAADRGLLADGVVVDVATATASARILLRVPHAQGDLHPPPCGDPGQRIRAQVRLFPRRPSLVPAFRSRRMAVRRGVQLYGEVIGPCQPVPSDPLADAIQRAGSDHAGLLGALATGDRTGASLETEAKIVRAGLGPLLEMSSLAIALLAFAVAHLLRRRPKIASGVAIAIVVLGALIYAATPSILRLAVVMIFLLLPQLERFDRLDALALSLILVLAISPAALGDVRFQLAFAGLSSAVRLYPALAEKVPKVGPVFLPIAVALGTLPLTARLFDHVTIVSMAIAPLAIVLMIGLAAPLSIFGGLLALISPALGAPLLHLAALAIDALLAIAREAQTASVPTPTMIECVIFYAIITAIAAKPSDPPRAISPLRFAAALAGVLAAWTALGIWKRSSGDELEAAILPTASGQAYVVRLPDGSLLARDTSPPAAWFQMEQRLVGNQLKLRRHTDIDALIADPADDHSAARELAQQFPIREVWWTRAPVDPVALEHDRTLDQPIERAGARIEQTQAGLRISLGDRAILFASTATTASEDAVVLPDGTVRSDGRTYDPQVDGMIRIRIENGALHVVPLR
jgi:hypothetical protein